MLKLTVLMTILFVDVYSQAAEIKSIIFRDRMTCEGETKDQSLFGPILSSLEKNDDLKWVGVEEYKENGRTCLAPLFELRFIECVHKRSMFSDEITYELILTPFLVNHLSSEQYTPTSLNGLSLGFQFDGEGMKLAPAGEYPLLIDSSTFLYPDVVLDCPDYGELK